MPVLDQIFACIVKSDLNRLIHYLKKDPSLVNAKEEQGISLLHYAVLLDKPEIVIYLSNNIECNLSPQENHYGHTPLHVACFHSNMRIAQHLLTKMTVEAINMQDKFGWTPLHHAARSGNIEICRLLVKFRARVDIRNELGKTPLHYASQHGYLDILKELYDLATPSLITPSATECFTLPVMSLLHLASLNNQASVVNWLQHDLVYPPHIKCRRAVHQNGEITLEEYPEDTASSRGHLSLKTSLQSYRQQYESWIQDIRGDHAHLGHIRISLCGPPDSGKTCLGSSLVRSTLQQMLLNWEEVPSTVKESKNPTYGIDIKHINLSNESLHVWDFSGDSGSYSTHPMFLSANHTMYLLVVDLRQPLDEIETSLVHWLSLIKMKNLGALQPNDQRKGNDLVSLLMKTPSRTIIERSRTFTFNSVPKLKLRRFHTANTFKLSNKSNRFSSPSNPSPLAPPDHAPDPALHSIPLFIIGSHHDAIPTGERHSLLYHVECLIQDLAKRYRPSIDVIPQVFPMNCLKPNTAELKYLKEQMAAIKSLELENEVLYPRIFEKVIRKIDSIKLQHPERKVMEFDEMYQSIKETVNRLLSERQLVYIMRCLTDAGMVVYVDQGTLGQWLFLDPSWVCQDILGHAQTTPLKDHTSHMLTKSQITSCLANPGDGTTSSLVLDLLQSFLLCYRGRTNDLYTFPSFNTKCLSDEDWTNDPSFTSYNGRWLVCCDSTDFFPSTFIHQLQVQLSSTSSQGETCNHYKDAIIVTSKDYQFLIKIGNGNQSMNLIGRLKDPKASTSCIYMMDHIHNSISKLCRHLCPALFFKWKIFSGCDLKGHASSPHIYRASDVVQALQTDSPLWNETSEVHETVESVMFFDDESLLAKHSGRNMYLCFLPDDVFTMLEQLLDDGEFQQNSDWKELAVNINLSEYIELLRDRKEPVRDLLMKWGEKPRWTIDNLLYALQEIRRHDAYNLLRAKTDTKYKTTISK